MSYHYATTLQGEGPPRPKGKQARVRAPHRQRSLRARLPLRLHAACGQTRRIRIAFSQTVYCSDESTDEKDLLLLYLLSAYIYTLFAISITIRL